MAKTNVFSGFCFGCVWGGEKWREKEWIVSEGIGVPHSNNKQRQTTTNNDKQRQTTTNNPTTTNRLYLPVIVPVPPTLLFSNHVFDSTF
jgi:hypothetical protein